MLQQVGKRLDERIKNNLLCETETVGTKVRRPHTYGPIIDSLSSGTQYETINFSHLDISIFSPGNVVAICDGSTEIKVLLIENIVELENDFFLVGKMILRYCNFFQHFDGIHQVVSGREWYQICLVRYHFIEFTQCASEIRGRK
jgi:hypothetical protein